MSVSARTKKVAAAAVAVAFGLTLAMPGTAFAGNKHDNDSHANNWSKNYKHDKDHRVDEHNSRPSVSCTLPAPDHDGDKDVAVLTINGNHTTVRFVDASTLPSSIQPCVFPSGNGGKPYCAPSDNDGAKNDHDADDCEGNKPSGNTTTTVQGHGGTTTTTVQLSGATGASGAPTTTTTVKTSVLGETITRNSDPSTTNTTAPGSAPAQVLGETISAKSGTLPFTGTDVVELVGIGTLFIAIGIAALVVRRRALADNN